MLEVGRVLRAHGVRGDLVVRSTTDRDERWKAGSVLDLDGRIVTVTGSRTQSGDVIVHLAEVSDRGAAEALRGAVFRAERIDDDGDELWVADLIGATVVDVADGSEKGVVKEVHESPASDLLILDTGHVVPVTFVERLAERRVEVAVPDGLWELLA